MSFGSGTGRTRSGAKGFSSKEKKQKRKKQEFHSHRRYAQESERPNPEEVRARTILALDRLGHQVISTEGGYDLQDWMRSLDSLLDDFEEKIGDDRITDEFRRGRSEAVLPLASPSTPGDIDSEIEKAAQEETAARARIAELEKNAAARLASLREERDACEKELPLERERLAEIREEKQSRQFFSRLLRAGPSTEQAEARVAELEAKLVRLDEEIGRSRKARLAQGGGVPGQSDSAYLEAEQRLEAARDKLAALHSSRQSRMQLGQERELATKRISELISAMKLDGAPSGEASAQELQS